MASLEKEAKRALEGPNFVDATRAHDDLMAKRKRLGRERADLVASVHGRHEDLARKAAVASGTADARGSFRLAAPPGSYELYARFVRDGIDVEWIETAVLATGGARATLDETNARHLAP
jgi:hypothetical protein